MSESAAQGRANAVYQTISDADLIGEIRLRYTNQPSLPVLALCERYERLSLDCVGYRDALSEVIDAVSPYTNESDA